MKQVNPKKQAGEKASELPSGLAESSVGEEDRRSDLEIYSYMVSHELKTPIREISLYAEFVEEDNIDSLSSQSIQDLRSIRRLCASMIDIFQNIMDYSRVKYKQLCITTVDMYDLVWNSFHQQTAEYTQHEILLEISPLPKLQGDAFLLRQMVNNILSNSVKYTELEPHPVITVSAYEEKDKVVYRFQDNGIGLDMQDSTKAFQLFERLHGEEFFEGSGIGLAMVKQIVERFEGNVEIMGKPNKGCVVTVSFPKKYVIQEASPRIHTAEDVDAIKIGVIGDFSGQFSFEEMDKRAAYELARDEINQAGGIDGRPVELLFRDDKSDIVLAEEHARNLTENEHVDVIMGAFLSPNREAIRGIIDHTKTLYFYNEHYEGGVADHYTFCTSMVPEHIIYPALDYLMERMGNRIYLVVADYIWGILIAEGIKNYVRSKGTDVVAVEYLPLSKANFRITIENILETQPDILVFLGVGQNHNHFHVQWSQWGNPSVPILAPNCINESYLHKLYPPPLMENTYFMTSYIEELETEKGIHFRESFRKRHSSSAIPYLGSEAEVAYTAVYLYKLAVELAGTTETEAVIKALESDQIVFDGPGGRVQIRSADHHVVRDIKLFRVAKDHSVEVIQQFPGVKSDFVEQALLSHTGVDSLKKLGTHAPNLQYSLMYNRYINML